MTFSSVEHIAYPWNAACMYIYLQGIRSCVELPMAIVTASANIITIGRLTFIVNEHTVMCYNNDCHVTDCLIK